MTVRDVSGYLRCSESTVRRMVGRAEIPHFHLGRLVRFRRTEVDAWLALHHEGRLPVEELPGPDVHPDQLFLFSRDVGAGA